VVSSISRAVFDRAAVGVSAPVAAVLQELVLQVAVRPVQFDTVEACLAGVPRGSGEIGDDAGDFGNAQLARYGEFDAAGG